LGKSKEKRIQCKVLLWRTPAASYRVRDQPER
jgi:hypothetical protein